MCLKDILARLKRKIIALTDFCAIKQSVLL